MAHPHVPGLEALESGVNFGHIHVGQVPLLRVAKNPVALVLVGQPLELDMPGNNGIFNVMDRVGNVISEVHDLGFDATLAFRGALAQPVEDGKIVSIGAEFTRPQAINDGCIHGKPRVFR